ncbi:MAG: hypothetical protein ACLP1X_08220 [Polyangiaceae bacterium]
MRMNRMIVGLGALLSLAAAAAACSSSSSPSNPGSGGVDSGGSSSGGSSSSGSSSGGVVGDAGDAGDAGGDAGSTLYSRLGGHAGIRAAVDAIVAAELADADIKTYFFNQVATPVPAGHPTADQIEECFTDLLGMNAGGPEVYPTTVVTLTDAGADAGSFLCRDLGTIHAPLKISGGTFDKFVMIAGGVLTSAMGMAPYTYTTADITTVAGVLTGSRSAVVDSNLNDAGAQVYPGPDAH